MLAAVTIAQSEKPELEVPKPSVSRNAKKPRAAATSVSTEPSEQPTFAEPSAEPTSSTSKTRLIYEVAIPSSSALAANAE